MQNEQTKVGFGKSRKNQRVIMVYSIWWAMRKSGFQTGLHLIWLHVEQIVREPIPKDHVQAKKNARDIRIKW